MLEGRRWPSVGICQLVNVLGLEAFNLRAVIFLRSQRRVRVMLWQQHAWGSATLPYYHSQATIVTGSEEW